MLTLQISSNGSTSEKQNANVKSQDELLPSSDVTSEEISSYDTAPANDSAKDEQKELVASLNNVKIQDEDFVGHTGDQQSGSLTETSANASKEGETNETKNNIEEFVKQDSKDNENSDTYPKEAQAETHAPENEATSKHTTVADEKIDTLTEDQQTTAVESADKVETLDFYDAGPKEEDEVKLYDPSRPITHRIELAIQKFRKNRKFNPIRNQIFSSYLRFGGIDTGQKSFLGNDGEDDPEADADEILTRRSTDFIEDEELEVDFTYIIKVYLSSYLIDKSGYVQMEQFREAPLVINSFLNYLITHDVCPEYIKDMEQALKIVELAKKELPKCKLLAQLAPGKFNKACSLIYGGELHGMFEDPWGGEENVANLIGISLSEGERIVEKVFGKGALKLHWTGNTRKALEVKVIEVEPIQESSAKAADEVVTTESVNKVIEVEPIQESTAKVTDVVVTTESVNTVIEVEPIQESTAKAVDEVVTTESVNMVIEVEPIQESTAKAADEIVTTELVNKVIEVEPTQKSTAKAADEIVTTESINTVVEVEPIQESTAKAADEVVTTESINTVIEVEPIQESTAKAADEVVTTESVNKVIEVEPVQESTAKAADEVVTAESVNTKDASIFKSEKTQFDGDDVTHLRKMIVQPYGNPEEPPFIIHLSPDVAHCPMPGMLITADFHLLSNGRWYWDRVTNVYPSYYLAEEDSDDE
ncbi:12755_t:CDS:2 [Acaulospora morrowiae]|uniref:12755_t:CDS:1 n=1 Tax=Acaulospora morrowiae TaxID=94023 RepID=A0A9N9CE86_9GLOM|nr:12755_t:CDS:2 [Acaulospora morrowiae]